MSSFCSLVPCRLREWTTLTGVQWDLTSQLIAFMNQIYKSPEQDPHRLPYVGVDSHQLLLFRAHLMSPNCTLLCLLLLSTLWERLDPSLPDAGRERTPSHKHSAGDAREMRGRCAERSFAGAVQQRGAEARPGGSLQRLCRYCTGPRAEHRAPFAPCCAGGALRGSKWAGAAPGIALSCLVTLWHFSLLFVSGNSGALSSVGFWRLLVYNYYFTGKYRLFKWLVIKAK